MKTIYENLDTSFVNLPALVRFLRRKNFVGSVRVELNGYEAEIVFSGENEPNARENDRKAGRVAEGEGALQRILIRAREAGGIINVYQAFEDKLHTSGKNAAHEVNAVSKPSAHKSLIIENSPSNESQSENERFETAGMSQNVSGSDAKRNSKLDVLPFDLSNKVEAKAKQSQLSDDEWQTLLDLIGELLRTVDETLASANLNFPAAFQKASAEVSEDYPFLNPNSGAFVYQNGEAEMREQVNAKLFAASINEALRRILAKLSANPKYAEAERATVQSILALIHHRKALYDKFYITPQLEKTLRA
ncbi:MAG TPA: hypothetical protein VF556_16660 [Pyrinomonadaceae bacterium]|jgi:hypothetical protein